MLPGTYPKIDIYWSFEKDKAKEYKVAFSHLVFGQIDALGDSTVGVAIVEGMRRAIPIAITKPDLISDISSRLSMAALFSDDYFPAILLEQMYFDAMRINPVVRTNIYHEIGHFFMKHVNRSPDNAREIAVGRAEAHLKGEVFWQEREADAFACHYVGKETMIAHLNELKRITKKLAKSDRQFSNELSVHLEEIDQRIQLIQEAF